VTEPAVPDTVPASAATVIGTQLERLAQIAAELGDQALATDARADHDRLMEARFFVACLGQFKRGKSTLLNALVGEAVLPVGVVPVTSVVTILRYGDPRAAIVRFSDGHTKPFAFDAIAMFIDERQNPGNHRQAAIVDVALPSPILRDGLCLVDTPGLGSVHAVNTEATRDFVPRTDVALVVVGPDPPISGAERQLIEEVSREAGELMVVLNKADGQAVTSRRAFLHAALAGGAYTIGVARGFADTQGNRRMPRVIVCDVNETLLDVGALEPHFKQAFGDGRVLHEWFANVLLYSEVATLAGPYSDFASIGGAALDMVASARGITLSSASGAEAPPRSRHWRRQPAAHRKNQAARPVQRDQPGEQGCALQLPLNVQWDALRHTAGISAAGRYDLLVATPTQPGSPQVTDERE
jgi:Dynamin family